MKPIFTENKIFFPCAKDFNDPFDSQLKCSASGSMDEKLEWIASKIEKQNRNFTRAERLAYAKRLLDARPKDALQQSVDGMVERAAKSFGILSMSEKNDDLLMWAHYGDKHHGFCLQFDTRFDFFGGAVQVGYEEKYPKQQFFKRSHDEITRAHATKGKHWEYEAEWRVFALPLNGAKSARGSYKFPSESLVGVIFGLQMSSDTESQIRSWIQAGSSKPNFYKARKKPDEFGLIIEAMDRRSQDSSPLSGSCA